jgi:hypothetical protein
MAKKPSILKDEDILAKVSAKSQTNVSWADSRLSKERERVTRYINGELPKRNNEGSSSYVSSDVYDSVQMMVSQTLEVYSGGEQIAKFDPDADMDVENCRVATECARYVIFRENPHHSIFQNVIYDGLTCRAGVAKVYWDERHKSEEKEFEGLDEASATALAAREEVSDFDATEQPDGTFKGTLTTKKDCSKVAIDPLAPEEFLIDAMARSIDAADIVEHRTPKTRAELIDMGYPRALVMSLPADEAKMLQFSPEVLARRMKTSDGTEGAPVQDEMDYIVYYESYIRMQIDSSKGVRLYQICRAGDKILSKKEVDKAPFLAFIPLPIPHVFYGFNYAAQVIHTQNANTVLFRGVLDHTAITSNPRFFVVNGGLLNPRELLDNRLGGVVNVRRPDSVQPMQQNQLNSYVFQTMQVLDSKSEKSTGISALSQGLNKDAISTQNSRGLVDNMIKVGSGRQKIIARNFAYDFFVPLMIEVVRLLIENHKGDKVIEIAGAPITVTPEVWTARTSCSVSLHLGYGEKDMAANELAQGYQMMAKDPGLGTAFGLKQRTAMLADIAKLKGFTNFSSYIDPNAQPAGPDPLAVRELDIKERQVAVSEQANQFKASDASRLYAAEQVKADQKGAELKVNALDQDRTNDRQDMESAARVSQGEEQIDIDRKRVDIEREKVAAQERIAARNAAAKAKQPKGPTA